MDEPRFDPLDYVSVFNRRKWWFIIPMTLALIVGGLLVWKLPRTYQATTTIAVSAARLAPNIVGAVAMERSERMQAVSQQLLSRTVLERTARLEHLDQNGSIESAINRIRGGVSVTPSDSITPSNGDPGGAAQKSLAPEQKAQLDTYQVSYVDGSPDDAQRIVNRLAQVFVEENSRSREVRAQDTSQFIETQLQASGVRLADVESKLRTMKESFMGRLPEQTNANLAMVSAMQRQLESNATTARAEQDRLSMIERQLDAMQQNADSALIDSKGTPGEAAATRVQTLRRELGDAQLTYTDKHPEIVRLKDELATAEKAAAAERTRPAADRVAILNANPEFRQLQKDREVTKMRIAELQHQQAAITGQIAQYQTRVEGAPRVEQQMVALQRQYDLERSTYQDLSGKKQTALLDEELQRKQGGEQFAVLVPAGLPAEPFKPKPLRVMLLAIAAGLVLGGALAFGREYLDRSVHDARGLRDEFELPVLAEIPRIEAVMG
ncbi:MAG: tyrosine kinase [Acidobacteria bacterium]|nr:tyrosine kinase [Acidobacteriota bacterium]